MNNTYLSICIPTYNRADFLKQCLDSIVSQFSDPQVSENVDVVISDNNSVDGTESLVKEYQVKYPNIYYHKNSSNLGVDRNILHVVEMSHGKFAWLLGDDDALFPDALAYALGLLKQAPADYFIANYWAYNNPLTEKALKAPHNTNSQDRYFTSLEQYVTEQGQDIGLVGIFCGLSVQLFLKQPWLDMPDKERYIGTNAVHLHTLMTAMKQRKFCILAKPSVKARSSNIRWGVFDGLSTFRKRAETTQKIFLWILNEYKISHSSIKLKILFLRDISTSWAQAMVRKHILKNQKTRDLVKKILGKL